MQKAVTGMVGLVADSDAGRRALRARRRLPSSRRKAEAHAAVVAADSACRRC